MKPYVIASFYKFVPLDDYESIREPLLNLMRERNLLGTVLLAHEGINGTVAGSAEEMRYFYNHLNSLPAFTDLSFHETYDDFIPFDKAKVKFRNEIVTLGVDANNADPLKTPGMHVPPDEWNKLISDPDVLVIDTRNDYEVGLGTFKNAINPKTDTFRDFPQYVEQHLLDKKDKKIAMYCTGGIRCEKSTAYLRHLGFEQVYQLSGGILNYMDQIPEEKSLWQGTCFVFDDRIAIEK